MRRGRWNEVGRKGWVEKGVHPERMAVRDEGWWTATVARYRERGGTCLRHRKRASWSENRGWSRRSPAWW